MRKLKTLTALVLLILTLTAFTGCRITVPEPVDISTEDEVQAMGFRKGDYDSELKVGEYSFFEVEIKIDYQYVIEWYSSNPEVATVDSNGRVDALSPGKVTITCKARKAEINFDVTVTKGAAQELSFTTAKVGNTSSVQQNLTSGNAGTPYAILVNTRTNCMTVYTYNSYGIYSTAVRSMVCSVNKDADTNEFYIGSKEEWASSGGGYCRYVTNISNERASAVISSCEYSQMSSDSLVSDKYNELGQSGSGMDIRMSAADAKWVYDNCGEGTLVKVTYAEKGDPLGKPEAMKLTSDSASTSWDPTDSDEKNPYNKLRPVFSGVEEAFVEIGGTFDAYSGVVVRDTCNNESDEEFDVDGSVPCSRAGRYIITYTFKDSLGRTGRADRVVNVLTASEYAEYAKEHTEPVTELQDELDKR